jgi:hypothetical protein
MLGTVISYIYNNIPKIVLLLFDDIVHVHPKCEICMHLQMWELICVAYLVYHNL